ncbi:MAG TPA: RNA polymerase sigma factor [Anaerovoracaceae bacterium]|nr:RNA polymerase sigma factor [Anaerovoracaceae bacterium]
MEDFKNFDQLYRNNYNTVYSFIYNITFDKTLTEDISQEAFIRAYNHIDSFRHESNTSVWLNQIAYNLFIDYKRKKSSSLLSIEDEILKSKLVDMKNDLSKEVEQKIMSECVQKKISLLPENYRATLFLDMHGYSNQEIASILNCTLENTKIRLHRARRKMKEILGNDCNFYYDERNVLCCESKK